MEICALRVACPPNARKPEWYEPRTPSLFWLWHPIAYHVSVMRAVVDVAALARKPSEPFLPGDITEFVAECEEHVRSRAQRHSARVRQDLDLMGEEWLLPVHDREVWESCHKDNWATLAFPDKVRHHVDNARLRRLLVPLVCWLAMRCSVAPGDDGRPVWSAEGVRIVARSEAIAQTLPGWQSTQPSFSWETGNLAHYAATAWIEMCKEVTERIRFWVADAQKPRLKPVRVKQESAASPDAAAASDSWSPPETPCYGRRLAAMRVDPFTHGYACKAAPIQLIQLVDPEDGGLCRNTSHWQHKVQPLTRQTVPDLPFSWSAHPLVASYATGAGAESEVRALCGHVQTDQPHLLITVLIAENVPPSHSAKAVAGWRNVDVCSPDVTKNVNLKAQRAAPSGKRKSPGKGNTAAGGKSQVADLLKKQVERAFDRWRAAKDAHPDQWPVLRLVYHPSSVQHAYMVALFFAYRYILYTAKQGVELRQAGADEVVQALREESLWQKTVNTELAGCFAHVVQLHAMCMLRNPARVALDAHAPGCPFAPYGPRVCATLDKLDVSILVSSSDASAVRMASPPADWWPLMMTKRSVCRTWSDDLNKYRIEQLGIDKEHENAKHKLTSSDVTLVSVRTQCLCDPWEHSSVEDRDEALHRLALSMVCQPPMAVDEGMEWFYSQMHPREWTPRAVEARLKEPHGVLSGIVNPLAQLVHDLYFLAYPGLHDTWLQFLEHKRAVLDAEWAARCPIGIAGPLPRPRIEIHDAEDEDEPEVRDEAVPEPRDEELDEPAVKDEPGEPRRVRQATTRCRLEPLRVDWERPAESELRPVIENVELLATCPSFRTLAAVHDIVVHASRWPWHEWRGRLPSVVALAQRFAQDRQDARVLHFRLLGHQYYD